MSIFIDVLVSGILLGGIYGLVSIGLNLIFGVIRVVNFAQGELVMLGMYGTVLVTSVLGVGPYWALLLVVPVLFVFGVGLQRFLLQPLQDEPSMQIFATFGVLIVLENAVLALTSGQAYSVTGPLSQTVLSLGGTKIPMTRLVVLIACTVATAALVVFLRRTIVGKSIRAVIQDRKAARLMGIDVERTYRLTFGLGAALAGAAGVLLAPIYTLSPYIGGNFIVAAFAVVVLGGLGSVTGAYLGGFVVGLVEAFAGYYVDPALKQAIWFLIFIAVLILRPSGLLGQVGAEEVGLRAQR